MTAHTEYRVVEKDNPLAVHCLTWSAERCRFWIEGNGKQYFPDTEFKAQGMCNGTHLWEDIAT